MCFIQKAKIAHERLRKDFETWLKEFQEVSKLSVAKERETAPRPDDDAAVFKGLGTGPNAGLSSNVAGGMSPFTEQVFWIGYYEYYELFILLFI